jgi:integrase
MLSIKDSTISNTQKKAKYQFGLALLTGMGNGDLSTLTNNNIKENEHGIYIEKKRNKTNINFKIYLTENAKCMLNELIRLTSNENKLINLPSLDYSNRMFKQLAKKVGINKNVTSYVARHTFAVNYMENGGKIEDLQVILGHSSILITSKIYGKISDKRLSEAMKQQSNNSPIHQITNNKLMAV